jgi:O-antigen ligase
MMRGVVDPLTGQNFIRDRFSGTLSTPSAFATFVTVGLMFTSVRLLLTSGVWSRLAQTTALAAGSFAVLLSLTRTAWTGMLLGTALLFWRFRSLRKVSALQMFGLAAIGLICVAAAWPALASRVSEDHNAAWVQRWNLIAISWEMTKAHPLIGVGINNASEVVWKYASLATYLPTDFVWVFVVHNQYALMAAELGLPGLLAFLVVLGIPVKSAWDCSRMHDPLVQQTGLALFTSLVVMLWAMVMDHIASAPSYILLWFLCGAALGVRSYAKTLGEGERVSTA